VSDRDIEAAGARLLATTDGLVWATEFVRLRGGDTDLMLAWFANAIETGRMAGAEASTPSPETLALVTVAEDVLVKLGLVVADSESQHPGGWGPDTTTVAYLRDCQRVLRAAVDAWLAKASALDDETLALLEAARAYIDFRDRRLAQWAAVATHKHACGTVPCPEWDVLTSEPFDIDQRLDDAIRAALDALLAKAEAGRTE